LGSCDLSRVPFPAAMMATATRGGFKEKAGSWGCVDGKAVFERVDGFVDFFIRPTIP
jgi:hypothetical protein